MKKAALIMAVVTAIACSFIGGFFIGRNANHTQLTLSDVASSPAVTFDPGVAAAVNINTADVYELDALPGIGRVLAQRIVDYREKNGLFTSVEQLAQVEGIGQDRMDDIRQYITIGG